MRGTTAVETGKDRKVLARDAGMGQVSLISILAGTLVAFATFALLLAVAAGILAAVGVDTAALTSNDWERLGIGGGIVAALVLFLSYFFGGYISGRMARRAGALNGGLVFLTAILIGLVIAVVVGSQADTEAVARDLRVLGVPTSGSEYGDIGTVAGIAAIVAMLLGAILGGLAGERWHGKLAARALSPDVGPEAQARHEMTAASERRYQPHSQSPAPAGTRPETGDWASQDRRPSEPVATRNGAGEEGDVASRPQERPLRSEDRRGR